MVIWPYYIGVCAGVNLKDIGNQDVLRPKYLRVYDCNLKCKDLL